MSLSRREVALWALAAAVVCGLGVARGLPQVTNDGTQYLSVADHLAAGDGALTSYAHFETEVARGCPPVAMTTFPPGYAAATVPLRWLGMDRVWAAAAVSAAAFILLMLVVARLAAVLALPRAAARLALLLTVGSHEMARHAMAAQSESLFTLLLVAAAWASAEALAAERTAMRRAFAFHLGAGVLLGAAYWVRYAALFVIVPFGLFHAGRFLLARHRRGAWLGMAGLGATAAIVGVGFLRNLALSGNIRGGNTIAMAVPLGRVARETVYALLSLLVGDENLEQRPLAALAGVGLFVAALAVVVFLGRATLRRRPRPSAAHLLFVLTIGVYSAAIA